MNSLLGGGFGNAFMNMNKMNSTAPVLNNMGSPNILMQAMGAALRGESPQQFMQNLAQTHPQLKQYDLSNLPQAAEQICQQNGVDMQQAINQIDNMTSGLRK